MKILSRTKKSAGVGLLVTALLWAMPLYVDRIAEGVCMSGVPTTA